MRHLRAVASLCVAGHALPGKVMPSGIQLVWNSDPTLKIGAEIWRSGYGYFGDQEATTPFGVLGRPKVIDNKTLPSKVS
jgi:hypothetical protein